ncbi:MAG: DUF1289 domain-containing protein [Pseudomonadota bacterium]|uniref:DUF1289 domain-containing protein n=1 Tax=Phenylobacterium sp. TaxID=1871053 RepID=UPI00271957CF|nr:DUF1289 domain-containing protein [Phenylobacterium sp.]MDO9431687.1 DUF1289 domain-containing protein [Phenylobacterium sp.]
MTDQPLRPPAPIKTPCIKVCVVDGESGLCMGCYRQLSEVAGWAKLTDDDRARIMTELPDRRSRIRPEKLAMF